MTSLITLIGENLSMWTTLLVASGATIVGDVFAKSWSLYRRPWLLAMALVAYFCGSIFYIPALLHDGLVVTSVIWTLAATLGFIVVGLLFFHEHLSFWQGVGVALGTLALIVFAFIEK